MEALKWYGGSDTEFFLSSSISVICGVLFGVSGYSAKVLARVKRGAFGRGYSWRNLAFVQIFLYYVRFCGSERVKHLNAVSRLACMVRALRAFIFPWAHKELFGMDVFANFVSPQVNDDMFHHLSRRYYLAKNLCLRKRVEFVLSHYRFEERFFDKEYKQDVYLNGGLVLWEDKVNGVEFQMRLMLADRYAAEGDLCIALMVDGARLHAISFSWITDNLAEQAKVVLFVGLNQSRWQKELEYQRKFNAAFPGNSANFVCYAALQGLARAVDVQHMVAVSGALQVCFSTKKNRSFENAYDDFWKNVGGAPIVKYGFSLPVPWPKKDLSTLPSKHRKRAANRRLLLNSVETETLNTLIKHLRHTRLQE
jgi:uncharacterized protein VirK/YbjX